MWVEPGASSAELKFGLSTTFRSFTPLTPNSFSAWATPRLRSVVLTSATRLRRGPIAWARPLAPSAGISARPADMADTNSRRFRSCNRRTMLSSRLGSRTWCGPVYTGPPSFVIEVAVLSRPHPQPRHCWPAGGSRGPVDGECPWLAWRRAPDTAGRRARNRGRLVRQGPAGLPRLRLAGAHSVRPPRPSGPPRRLKNMAGRRPGSLRRPVKPAEANRGPEWYHQRL